MNVLLTNDDGINAPGLRALYAALVADGHHVDVVAPMRQQSGVSHSLTVFEPLRAERIVDGDFTGIGVYGTPTDCVKLALGQLLDKKPDLVMAGINQGPNVGPDIFYSGTVGAAAEAAHDGVPSMAISHASHTGSGEIDAVAAHAVELAKKIRWDQLPRQRVINVNYPDCPLDECRGQRVCPQSLAVWNNTYSERDDPRGLPYWWLTGSIDPATLGETSDRHLLFANHITITPLKFEYTDLDSMAPLREMELDKTKW